MTLCSDGRPQKFDTETIIRYKSSVTILDGQFRKKSTDKERNINLTKGKKRTVFQLPSSLLPLLKKWQEQQKDVLPQINTRTSPNQFLFTYTNRKNERNVLVHIDYLNYRMKSIQRRHPELAHATPHKL